MTTSTVREGDDDLAHDRRGAGVRRRGGAADGGAGRRFAARPRRRRPRRDGDRPRPRSSRPREGRRPAQGDDGEHLLGRPDRRPIRDSLDEALQHMAKEQVRRLPVVDERPTRRDLGPGGCVAHGRARSDGPHGRRDLRRAELSRRKRAQVAPSARATTTVSQGRRRVAPTRPDSSDA